MNLPPCVRIKHWYAKHRDRYAELLDKKTLLDEEERELKRLKRECAELERIGTTSNTDWIHRPGGERYQDLDKRTFIGIIAPFHVRPPDPRHSMLVPV